jgi:arylsulfatase
MTRKRMETADEEFLAGAVDFIERSVAANKPFFVWFNSTRMHIHTRMKPESIGVTGMGLYPDGMVEHDGHVGQLLDLLDRLEIADNTIVIYSTDNGAEKATWPDGGTTPFHGEKGTTWEGGMRVPALVRWPGTIAPGRKIHEIMSHEDWMPTLLAAAGEGDIVEKLKDGHRANGKRFKIHPDGYNFMPYFAGEVEKGPREEIFYFDQGGNLDAVRWNDWKVSFATFEGNIADGVRFTANWPLINHLRADPYQEMHDESGFYLRWYADNMWLFVPVQAKVRDFFTSLEGYPFREGQALNAGGINYQSLKAFKILQELNETGVLRPPTN